MRQDRPKRWILLHTLAALAWLAVNPDCGQAADRVLHTFESQQLTDVYYSEGAGAGDLNQDGHADVVYGPYWFAGPDFKSKHEIYAAKPQPMERYADNFFSWVYDFNGDGWNDIFVVGFPGTPAYVYENPKADKHGEHWPKHEVFDWVSNESPQFTTIVGDEKPELICTRDGFFGYATIDWDAPFKTWKFHAISEKLAASRFGHGLGVGDVNSDGRIDILHAAGWFEQPKTGADTSRWTAHEVAFTTAYGGAEMYVYDVDGDGDNDVIATMAAHDFGLAWYEQQQDGDETTFRQHLIMGSQPEENRYGVVFSELHSLNLVDIDGDGLKDILTGKTYYSHHRQSPMWDAGAVVYWFRLVRTEDGVDWIPFRADGEAGIGRQLGVHDVNGDKLPDIVVGGMKGAHVLLHRTKKVDDATWEAAQPKVYVAPPKKTANTKRSPVDARTGRVAGAIEGEQMQVVSSSGGKLVQQKMGGFSKDVWSAGQQLFWLRPKPGDRLELELPVKQAGSYDVALAMTMARDYAIVQLYLDDAPLGKPIDCYNNPDVITTGVLELGEHELTAGKHRLTLEVKGANPAAVKAYMVGLDYVLLRDQGVRPKDATGRVLNLDFETGTLADWMTDGEAFAQQPIQGDTVAARRADMQSRHHGNYWIGGFENGGDRPQGTLTSAAFTVTHPWASFLMNGGGHPETRVELVRKDTGDVFYKVAGENSENLRQVVADLRAHAGKEIFIRLVDEHRGGWGHVNFDNFRFHATRPARVTPALVQLVPDEYPHAGLSAEEAAREMRLPAGFKATVAAAEPDVKQPIAMALDDRGRVWIAEAYEYPQRAPEGEGRDRILIFEDTNGDGKLDRRKVFAEGLNLVSGMEVGFGGVWVGAAPYLLFIPDKNGDDIPDGKPEVLLDGWGYQDTHETLNAFIWGPDGWLYGCHGVFTHSLVGKPETPKEERVPLNAAIWRYHPTKHTFEIFSHGTSNPWGVDFNERGQAFCTACVIPHLYHMIQGARYQRQAGAHFNPYTYDDIKTVADHLHYLGATPHSGNNKSDEVGGGHAHAGAMIYLGGAWPTQYRDQLFMNNIHGQRLNMDILKPRGSGYVGSHGPDFLLTGDQASQILNLRYGPDGQAYMIDWYDMQACHLREPGKHDRSNGRIYKISYGESKSVPVDLKTLSDVELAEMVLQTNDWYVRHARRILQERAAAGALAADVTARLTEIATTHNDETRRLRALWTLHVTGGISDELTQRLLADGSPYVRGWTIQLLMESQRQPAQPMLANFLTLAREDESPVVRLYLASACQFLPLEARWDILTALTSHAEDARDHNLPLMYWYAAEPLADVDPQRALALGLAAGESIPLLREFMLRRIGSADANASLALLVDGLGKAESSSLQLTFLKAIRAALQGQRQAQAPEGWKAVFAKLSSGDNAEVRLQAVALGVTFGDSAAMNEFRELTKDTSADVDARREALDALLAAKDPELVPTLHRLLSEPELRKSALQGLAQYDNPQTAELLLSLYATLPPDEKRSALSTLCARADSGIALLRAIETKRIAGSDLTADLVRQLQYLKHDEINRLLTDVWGNVRETAADKAEMIAGLKAMLAESHDHDADLPLGRAIFAKTCQRCHTLYGAGAKVGPDLTGSNRSNLDYLLSNIVDPSAVMAKEYQPTIIVTEDGRVVTGIVRAEDAKSVSVQTADATVIVPKSEIDERTRSPKSMMPDDQLKQFSEHEVRSLFTYLAGKQQVPILATADNAALLFNGKDLTGWTGNEKLWSVENDEIVGRSQGLRRNEFLVSDMTAEDFRLKLEIKLVDNAGNSGIQFRSEAHDGSVKGYQADVGIGWWGKLYEEHGRALLWDRSGEQHLKPGDWNVYEIVAEGSHIRTYLNGQLCVDLDDPEGARRGVFAFQLHSGGPTEVRLRNITLQLLPATSQAQAEVTTGP